MTEKEFERILRQGENICVEFKAGTGGVKGDTFETVCAFLNRYGGDIFLGVSDDRKVRGLPRGAVSDIIGNVIRVTGNPELFEPVFCLFPEAFSYRGKELVRLHVPQSSDVHRYKGVCYDRAFESDVRVLAQDQLAEMYIRKRGIYTERRAFPHLRGKDLRLDLLKTVRDCIRGRDPAHPWLKLGNERLLTVAGLLEEDRQTGRKVFNAAAVLLLGRDETIFDCFPNYRTDALVRRIDTERYDDRETVACNLIEALDRLIAFGARHLPDRFHLEDGGRVSLRNIILREAVANLLVHREFSSPLPARMIIGRNSLLLDNASKAFRCGPVTPDNLSPIPKNPRIANFFKQMGLVDELGSGTRNLYRCCRLYSGGTPSLMEGDTFITSIPIEEPVYQLEPEPPGYLSERIATYGAPLADLQERAFFAVAAKPGRGLGDVAIATGAPEAAVARCLESLVKTGKIEYRESPGIPGYYVLPGAWPRP